MDLHLLHRPPSQFSNGERFTVRSASSPSYGLNRRHGIRKARAESQEENTEDCKEKTQIDVEEKLAVSRAYPRGSVSVTLQLEENDKSSHGKASKVPWTGPTDSTIKGLNTDLRDSSQSLRDRAEWKGLYASNRSKSLDFRRRSRSPDGLSGLPNEQSSVTVKDTNATRGGVVPSLETFHCSRASIFLPRSTTTQSLDMLSRGHSVPTRLKSPTQTGSVFRSNSLLGARGGQSILERIEKLYGSTNVGTMEDYSKSGDLSSSDPKGKSSSSQFDGLTSDPYTSPNRRSSEVMHGTFPRRLSTTERNSQRSMKTRNSLPVQMDSHRLSFDSSLWAKTTERAPEYQSHMFIKGDRITSGTQSLDRARSRNTISGQIRTARFNRFVGPESDDASLRNPAEDNKLNINGNISEEKKTLKEQDKGKDIIQNLESRFSTTDDVFETDPQNSELKLVRRKALSAPAASVRNKINQFEAMTKKGSGPGLMQRRAFSVPIQHHATVDGVKKSGSARAIGDLKNKWEGVTEEREDDFKSVGEERKVDLEKEVKSFQDPEKDLVFYSRHKGLDEIDFSKSTSEPKRQIQESGQTEETEQPPALASPGSDLDKTPTNTPKLSPALSEDTPPARRPTSTNVHGSFTFPDSQDSPLLPLASASHSSTPRLLSQEAQKPSKPSSDLETWVSNWKSEIKVWNDTDDEDEDDEGTQKDGDSNYDSDSGESSITITSNISQSENRSFSVSLSDLYNFAGVDCDSETDSDEWKSIGRRSASLSSDMSALSYVSVLPAEELDRLIDDVKGLGENSLQEDVHVVVLHKEVGVGLGFSLAGGVDQNKPVTVHRVFHTGVAAQEGSVQEGDQVLSINGTALSGCAHWEALRVLRRAKTREMGVVVLRKGGGAPKRGIQVSIQGPAETSSTEPAAQQVCVRLEKNTRDLGFSLEGGAGLENRPLTVQKIFQGGPVDKVYPGDELLEVEGSSMVGMRRLEAWTLIRRLPPGPVDVILSRAIKKQET